MGVRKDLSGQKFNRLTVVRRSSDDRRWVCRCECGTETVVDSSNLKRGSVKSCGCFRREYRRAQWQTHGLSNHAPGKVPEYGVWAGMHERCSNANCPAYPNYGGRGIKVCEEWGSFETFYADMGTRPTSGHSIDRIDVNGNYEPGNCRWATDHEQQQNRRDVRLIKHQGKTLCVAEWARVLGVGENTLRERLRRGWSDERIITPPVARRAS